MNEYNLYSDGPFDLLKNPTYLSSHNGCVIKNAGWGIGTSESPIDIIYTKNTSPLPSPGFRIPINVLPGIPCQLQINAKLIAGDKAFIYVERKNKRKNEQRNHNTGYDTGNGIDAASMSSSDSYVSDENEDGTNLNENNNNNDKNNENIVKNENNDNDDKYKYVVIDDDYRIVPRIHWLENEGKEKIFDIKFVTDCRRIWVGILFYNNKDIDYHLVVNDFKLTMIPDAVLGIKKSRAKKMKKLPPVSINFTDVVSALNRAKNGVGVGGGGVIGTAVIVEPRCDPFLVKIIDHFLDVLPTHLWNVVVFHGNMNRIMLEGVFGENGRVRLIHLPVDNLNRELYSRLLLYREFYECIGPEHILIFQTDTCLNAKNIGFLDKLLGYDYVGAPWSKKVVSLTEPKKHNIVGNGGLSLRRKSSMIKVCQLIEKKPKYQYLWGYHEDQVITSILHSGLVAGPVKMPSHDIARKFSVESVFYPEPLGIHQAWRWLSTKDFAKLRANMPVIDQLFRGRIY